MKTQIDAERRSERELVSTRLVAGSGAAVFGAWTDPTRFQTWWVPKTAPVALAACEMDVRTGGSYRLVFRAGDRAAEFYGTYLEVDPPRRLVWTNDEGAGEAPIITTVTFAEVDGGILVTVLDLYPSRESLDEAIATGSCGAMPEQLAQLEESLADA